MALMTTEQERISEAQPYECPMCGKDHCRPGDEALESIYEFGEPAIDPDEIHHAAHCCLWKTRDHAARVRIAERVEAGANWADAIEGEAK